MNTSLLVSSETLMEELGTKKDAYYRDLKFLDIEIIKDNSGKSYVTPDDAERIKSLRKWVNKTGTRRGFVENKEVFEAESNEGNQKEIESNLVVSENKSLASNSTNHLEDIYVTPEEPTENINVDGLVRGAAELKAREIAMPDLVKRAFADKMTEADLPQDLKEKVNLAREAANPKFTPSMVAETLLARYRQQKAG